MFTKGRISAPGQEAEHPFVLWAHTYTEADGVEQIMCNGETAPVRSGAAVKNQVAAMMKGAKSSTALASVSGIDLRPRQLVLFPNRFKAEAPDKKRTDLWGAW